MKNNVISYYLNCALVILGPTVFQETLNVLKPYVVTGRILLQSPNKTDIETYGSYSVDAIRVSIGALFCLASISKVGAKSENINIWVTKRMTPLHIQLNIPTPATGPDMAADITIIGKYLDDNLDIRIPIYKPYLFKDSINAPSTTAKLYNAIRSQVLMILKQVGMSTFELSHAFAMDCETEVHTVEQVCCQSRYVINKKNELRALFSEGLPYEEEYYYIFNAGDNKFNHVHYADLAFCAINRQKQMGATSWQNYDLDDGNVTSGKQNLLHNLGIPLSKTDTLVENSIVQEYLREHGRAIDPRATPTYQMPSNIVRTK